MNNGNIPRHQSLLNSLVKDGNTGVDETDRMNGRS